MWRVSGISSVRASGSWHSDTSAPSQGSGTDAAPPEPMHQHPKRSHPGDSSAPPRTHFPKTQAPGPGPQHSHLRTAPPPGRGCGPLPRRPRSQPRCPRRGRSCTARRAPSDRRAGQGRVRSKAAGSSLISIPSSHPVPVGAAVRKRSHGWRRLRRGRQNRRRGGRARQPRW